MPGGTPVPSSQLPTALRGAAQVSAHALKERHRTDLQFLCASNPPQRRATASRRIVSRAQELEEFQAFAQTALHHLRARDHLTEDGGDLGRAKIELLVEVFDRIENRGV